MEVMYLYHIISGATQYQICLITGEANLDYLVKVVYARFLK